LAVKVAFYRRSAAAWTGSLPGSGPPRPATPGLFHVGVP
jgi:hypothetical protein